MSDRSRSRGTIWVPPEGSWASSLGNRRSMLANRGRDTTPEIRLRSRLHARGLRYRVHVRPLPDQRRTADVVFKRVRVAVFVQGCFWHGCPQHFQLPKTNADFWRAKIGGNVARDAETDEVLRDAGWISIRIWEHDDLDTATNRVVDVVSGRLSGGQVPMCDSKTGS